MRILGSLILLLVAAQEDPAKALAESIHLPSEETQKSWSDRGPTYATLVKRVVDRDLYRRAAKIVEGRLGFLREKMEIKVTFTETDEEAHAQGWSDGTAGGIVYNFKRMVPYEEAARKEAKRLEEAARRGATTAYRVPPPSFDATVAHELTHVMQGMFDAPDWFREGMATWVGDDPHHLCSFMYKGLKIETIDKAEGIAQVYARGHAFFAWVESKAGKEGIRKIFHEVCLEDKPWKEALETATKLEWEKILTEEQKWSKTWMRKYKR